MSDFLSKARTRRTVLKRTRDRADLPSPVLYMEWLAGESKRRVLDTAGKEHLLTDNVVQSNYKLMTGAQAKELIEQHWPDALSSAADPAV